MRLAPVALGLWMLACPARAEGGTDTPRAALYSGFGLALGPKVRTNGRAYGNPYGWAPVPAPEAALRVDLPVTAEWLLGLEGRVFGWVTDVEEDLGYEPHVSVDVGLSPAYRIAGILGRRHELHVALPLGASFDFQSARDDAPSDERVESSPGVHVGVVTGLTGRWRRSHFGYSFEGGVVYHRITQRVTYPGAGSGAADDIVYQPVSFFVRAGLVVYFAR